MISKEKIQSKIEQLEQDRTLIEFKEHLTLEDWWEINSINGEIRFLQGLLSEYD